MSFQHNRRGGASGRTVRMTSRVIPERILDGLPGIIAWSSLVAILVGATVASRIVFNIAVLLSVYMAVRMVLAGIANVIGLRHIRRWEATDWRAEYAKRKAADTTNSMLAWSDVMHVVVLPNYKEEIVILRRTLDRLALFADAPQQLVVVLAMEASEQDGDAKAEQLQREYADCFRHILITRHPRGIPGEVAGKSSNEAWAVRNARIQLTDKYGYAVDRLLVTICDADSLVHEKYFDALTCLYTTANTTDRHATVWQAPIRYHSNVWNIHPALGVIQAYSAAWELAYMAAPWWHPVPISTYSLSMKLAEDVGGWDTNVIAEDLHMFVKAFFARRGQLQLGRVYLPFSANAVTGDTFFEACVNRYTQTLRHAWGAKEIGYTLSKMIDTPDVAPVRSWQLLFRVAHDHLMAGAGWIVISFGQLIPVLVNSSIVNFSSPTFLVLQASLIIVSILGIALWAVDVSLRPARPRPWTVSEVLLTLVSFAALPVLTVLFVAIPVLEAQSRLMLGVPLQYKVARKI
jgi:hypothetical protein